MRRRWLRWESSSRCVGAGLAVERVLEVAHSEGDLLLLATELGGIFGEVADMVLLAQGPQAHYEDA